MEVTLHSNEPLAALLVLQPAATVWTESSATTGEYVLTAFGEGQQQAALKGEDSNLTGTKSSCSLIV
jgi:hypothetical protein